MSAFYSCEYDEKLIGKMVCFSFHPRKILTTGEGGWPPQATRVDGATSSA
jgi:hypothetical protein